MYLVIEKCLSFSYLATYVRKTKEDAIQVVDSLKKYNSKNYIKAKIYIIDLEEIEKYDIYKKEKRHNSNKRNLRVMR